MSVAYWSTCRPTIGQPLLVDISTNISVDRYVSQYVDQHILVDMSVTCRSICRTTCWSSVGRYVARYIGRVSVNMLTNRSVHEIHMIQKIQAWTWFEPVTSAIPMRCSTNWAVKATWEQSCVGSAVIATVGHLLPWNSYAWAEYNVHWTYRAELTHDRSHVALIAQLVEHCIGNAKVVGSNPVQSLNFFQVIFPIVLWLHSHLSFFHYYLYFCEIPALVASI